MRCAALSRSLHRRFALHRLDRTPYWHQLCSRYVPPLSAPRATCRSYCQLKLTTLLFQLVTGRSLVCCISSERGRILNIFLFFFAFSSVLIVCLLNVREEPEKVLSPKSYFSRLLSNIRKLFRYSLSCFEAKPFPRKKVSLQHFGQLQFRNNKIVF